MIWKLAEAGMNVARLNMSHGDHASHQKSSISCLTPRQNAAVRILLFLYGPEVRSGDSPQLITLTSRRDFTFEIKGGVGSDTCVSVSYDDFVNDVEVGGMLLVDGKNKAQKMVMFLISNAGQVANSLSLFILMRHLIVRGKSATLPSITEKDWDDIKFGVENNVDFYAVSFCLKRSELSLLALNLLIHLSSCNADIHVIVKIGSADSIPNLHSMVTHLMGQWLLEGILELNSLSMKFHCCRRKLLEYAGACESCYCSNKYAESMIVHPTPSRADVLDIAIAVREGSNPIMLSGETAHGKYLLKVVKVTRTVALRTEATINGGDQPANLRQAIKNHMSEMFGVCPIYMKFSDDAERTYAAEALSSYLHGQNDGEQVALVQSGQHI
ncbi:unnamed protein product [Musa acuminata subsp. malaccensis]|uniref:Pyruvate kinase n=1 Tax=Musa acuminata subsp. malaccensis TaxID=214687 RepID=A0A8D7AK85_MUSAM|nr:unnamed protein product [Musa acuminata subsp. malaccensis]